MGILGKFFGESKEKVTLSKEEIAEILKTDKNMLEKFEAAYRKEIMVKDPGDLFGISAKQASAMNKQNAIADNNVDMDDIVNRIVDELLAETTAYIWNGREDSIMEFHPGIRPVTLEEINKLDKSVRPQLTGSLICKHIDEPASAMLLLQYKECHENPSPKARQQYYHMFRQGMDILDLDPILYEMLGMNPNSIGNWLPQMVKAVKTQAFFKIPATTVIKVPITLLQLTRMDYECMTPTTMHIVDEYCKKAFGLDTKNEYFIKNGIFSSKFDFRNAYVHGEKEVNELGEYLLFIHNQATVLASPLNQPPIYGAATTNEWAVREFIHDKENNPSIYKGLPLHTEYRIFVDFDNDTVIGVSPYWKPDVMKHRFGDMNDKDSPHNKHDWVIYSAHEETLMKRYNDNIGRVTREIRDMLPAVDLNGQWSVDIMQNGNEFWIIDMAKAANSALIECVPPYLLKNEEEDWLPKIEIKD